MDVVEETWLTTGEAAKVASRDPRTIRSWADNGIIRSRTSPGGHRQIALSSLLQAQPGPGKRRSTRAPVADPDEVLGKWAEVAGEWVGWHPGPTDAESVLESVIVSVADLRSALDGVDAAVRNEFRRRDNADLDPGWHPTRRLTPASRPQPR